VRSHPRIGAEIIGEASDPLLQTARTMAWTHHERWDGTGYPDGLKGDGIPWVGRLMAIVDSFESLTTTRYHRDLVPTERAVSMICCQKGKRYDPALVAAFVKARPHLEKVRRTYGDALGDLLDLDFTQFARAGARRPSIPRADALQPVAKLVNGHQPDAVLGLQPQLAPQARHVRVERARQ
jgi:hypothetical protein